ncbi:MAG: hypothetical protein ACYTFU_10095 [Planctomycetota bacterium]|jgi:hypothetical protein
MASCWLAVGLFGPLAGDACWPASWPGGAVAWLGPSRGGQLVAWPGMWVVAWLGGLRASWLAGLAGGLCVWLAGGLAGSLAAHVAAWLHGWLGRGQPHSGMEGPFLSHGKFSTEEDHKIEACLVPKFRTEKWAHCKSYFFTLVVTALWSKLSHF